MANTKISQLPEYSGNPTGGYSVFNNSGETTTYKVRNYNLFGVNNTPGGDFPFIVGSGNTTGGNGISNIIVGVGNTITAGSSRPGDAAANMAIGRNNTNNDGYGSNSLVVGSDNTGNGHNSIMFGRYNSVPYGYAGMVGGINNTSTLEGACVVSSNSTSSGAYGAILGGRYSQMNGYAGGIGGTECNGMLGGYYNNLTGGIQSSIIGGQYNLISGEQYGDLDRCYYSSILGGNNNTIGKFVTGSTIIGSAYSTISGTSATTINSNILGGSNNIIGSLSNTQMIGCSGRTAAASATTYVENLHSYRTPSTEVQPVSSGTTFTCNLDNGAKSQFYITGTSTINITNVRDGASFMIKTQTDGNYVMTWTATGGYTFVFEGGIKDPGNNVTDIFVFEVFGSVIYGNRRHNYS